MSKRSLRNPQGCLPSFMFNTLHEETTASLSKNGADTEEWKQISALLTSGSKLVIIIHGFGQNITGSEKFKQLRDAVQKSGLGDFAAEIDWSVAARAEGGLLGSVTTDFVLDWICQWRSAH